MAWPKLVASVARGEIGEAHVKNFFRQAHRNMNHGRANFDAFKVFIGLLNAQLDECYAPPELSMELGECTKNAITVTVSVLGRCSAGAPARARYRRGRKLSPPPFSLSVLSLCSLSVLSLFSLCSLSVLSLFSLFSLSLSLSLSAVWCVRVRVRACAC